MSRGPHILSVEIPELTAAGASALAAGELAAAFDALGAKVDVYVTFGTGAVYKYPSVPASLAASLRLDPEGTFPSVRYWPGYERVQ